MKIDAAKICVDDVEQLSYSVEPWRLQMDQLSKGAFHGAMDLVQVGDILLSLEHWSNKIAACGESPAGYMLLAGPWAGEGFSWCNSKTDQRHLAFAADIAEVDFSTSDDEVHWTILIPRHIINACLGEDDIDSLLPDLRFLSGAPSIAGDLLAAIAQVLRLTQHENPSVLCSVASDQIYNMLLRAVTRFLFNCANYQIDEGNATKRFLAYRRARDYAERLQEPVSVEELARQAGTCRRTLELGFREAIGISPQTFLRYARLNGLHRDLVRASQNTLTVTTAAGRWGFTELGRTAGYYSDLFGMPPSETLLKDSRHQGLQYSDVLWNTQS